MTIIVFKKKEGKLDVRILKQSKISLLQLCITLFLDQVYLLKSIPLHLHVNVLAFAGISFGTSLDWTNVSVFSEKVLVFMSLVLLYHNIFKNMGCCIGDLGSNDIYIFFPVILSRWAACIVYILGGTMQLWIL